MMSAVNDNKSDGIFIVPRVPRGLAAAVESLTREVIRKRPDDIYTFAAKHFENLMRQRDNCQYDNDIVNNSNINGHDKWSHDNRMSTAMKNYDKSMIKTGVMMPSNQYDYYKQKVYSATGDMKIRRKIMNNKMDDTGKEIKVELKRNLSVDKIKEHVTNDFANVKSLNDLHELNYVKEIQEIIDNNSSPITNKKLEILNKTNNIANDNIVVKLDETRNLLQDISSCFSSHQHEYHRPQSADSAVQHNKRIVTNKLQTMLSETHNILMDISKKFLNNTPSIGVQTSNNIDKNNIDSSTTISSLPLVMHSNNNVTQNIDNITGVNKEISQILALPPVMIDCSIASSSVSIIDNCKSPSAVKIKHDNLTLPHLTLSALECRLNRIDNCPIENVNIINESVKEISNADNNIQNESKINLNECEKSEYIVNDDGELSKTTSIFDIELCHDDNDLTIPIEVNSLCNNIKDNNEIAPTSLSTDVIISPRNNFNVHDPLLDSFGEMIVTTTTKSMTIRPLENAMESLVDDMSSISSIMNQVVDMHQYHQQQHADLDCINEEEDVICDYTHDNDEKHIENMTTDVVYEDNHEADVNDGQPFDSENCHDICRMDEYNNERPIGSERNSSSTKETTITDGIAVGSTTNIENTVTGNDGSIVSIEMCESSNEAKETTLTDGISLSLDEPMRPFVPELNLDSLQDVTVSSFKMTEDDIYDDNTNSIVDTPTSSSYHCNKNDMEVILNEELDKNSSQSNVKEKQIEDICDEMSNNHQLNHHDHLEFQCNRDELDKTPFADDGDVFELGSRCTTQRINSNNLTLSNETNNKSMTIDDESIRENTIILNYDSNNDKDDNNDDKLYLMVDAVTKIQASIRGFLVRQRHQLNKLSCDKGDSHHAIDKIITDNNNKDVLHQVNNEVAHDMSIIECNTAIRSDYRGCHVGKRLCRENAIVERTETMSIDENVGSTSDVITAMNGDSTIENDGLQHTGEFHDWIVLPLHDYHVPALNENCNETTTTTMMMMMMMMTMMMKKKDMNEQTMSIIDESGIRSTNSSSSSSSTTNYPQVPIESMTISGQINNSMNNNIIKNDKLSNDMSLLSRLPTICHIELNSNTSNHFVSLPSGEIILVHDHYGDRVPSESSVIIEEITDESALEIQQIQSREIGDERDIDDDASDGHDDDTRRFVDGNTDKILNFI